jgi:hypothetical protein
MEFSKNKFARSQNERAENILARKLSYLLNMPEAAAWRFSRDESIKFRLSRASFFINAKEYASDFTFLQLHEMILLE